MSSCEENKIYRLLPDNSIQLSEKYHILWKAFNVPWTRRLGSCNQEYQLPSNNPVHLAGNLDPTSGFVRFQRLNGLPSEDSAIVNQGVALQTYRSDAVSLRYRVKWKASESVEWVSIYFLKINNTVIVPAIDERSRISIYKGNEGSAIFPRHPLMFVKVASSTDDFIVRLKVTALPPSENCTIPPEVCLQLKGECPILLYRNVSSALGNYTKVPTAQWIKIANLIKTTLTKTTALPPPLVPIEIGGGIPGTYVIKSAESQPMFPWDIGAYPNMFISQYATGPSPTVNLDPASGGVDVSTRVPTTDYHFNIGAGINGFPFNLWLAIQPVTRNEDDSFKQLGHGIPEVQFDYKIVLGASPVNFGYSLSFSYRENGLYTDYGFSKTRNGAISYIITGDQRDFQNGILSGTVFIKTVVDVILIIQFDSNQDFENPSFKTTMTYEYGN